MHFLQLLNAEMCIEFKSFIVKDKEDQVIFHN